MKLENLNHPEAARFVELERTIEQGRKTFVEVGLALCEIRDRRLYRSHHATFEDYCRAKWDFTRQYVNQIISGAAAVKSLPAGLETIVSNAGQALALAKVPPADREGVIRAASYAAKGRALTARDIQHASRGGKRTPRVNEVRWWWKKTPEKRGRALLNLISMEKAIEVDDPARVKDRVMKWLDSSLRAKKS